MTTAEREAAIAGARANVAQKHSRYDEARKALGHAVTMLDCAVAEYLDLVEPVPLAFHSSAPLVPGSSWCAGNHPALRTEAPA